MDDFSWENGGLGLGSMDHGSGKSSPFMALLFKLVTSDHLPIFTQMEVSKWGFVDRGYDMLPLSTTVTFGVEKGALTWLRLYFVLSKIPGRFCPKYASTSK